MAVTGDEVADVLHTFERKTAAQMSGMTGLSAGRASSGFLGERLGSIEWVGGRWYRGIAGVASGLGLQLLDALLQGSETLSEVGDNLIALSASSTGRCAHSLILHNGQPGSCAARQNRLGGYQFSTQPAIPAAS